uniref:(northern house mosquito) hypothetical protein n=1 Tax=Culex pipiens TaxID=7175 RepID=A0A8D8H0R7_CULPI
MHGRGDGSCEASETGHSAVRNAGAFPSAGALFASIDAGSEVFRVPRVQRPLLRRQANPVRLGRHRAVESAGAEPAAGGQVHDPPDQAGRDESAGGEEPRNGAAGSVAAVDQPGNGGGPADVRGGLFDQQGQAARGDYVQVLQRDGRGEGAGGLCVPTEGAEGGPKVPHLCAPHQDAGRGLAGAGQTQGGPHSD